MSAKVKIQKDLSISDFASFCLPSPVFRLLSSVFCLFLLSGCAKEQRSEVSIQGISIAGQDKTSVMQTAEDVLSEMHFNIEKSDANNGLIRTRPLPGAQFFEFWRSDNVGPFNSAEANLQSIRRIAEIRIDQKDKDISVNCDVLVERLSLPERQVSSSARTYQMFSRSTSSLQKLRLNPQQQAEMAWVNLGRDNNLAAEILKRISSMLDAH